MQSDNLNVFDLDGTLIRVNSFKEISKKLTIILLKRCNVRPLLDLIGWYLIRKLGFIKHLTFKQRVVGIFERELVEDEKREIAQAVFDANINRDVYERMLKVDNCVISTTAPFAFVSRMPFREDAIVISSLDYKSGLPDIANYGTGKVINLKYYFQDKSICISNFYTDSFDDQPLIDFSLNTYMVKGDSLIKVK